MKTNQPYPKLLTVYLSRRAEPTSPTRWGSSNLKAAILYLKKRSEVSLTSSRETGQIPNGTCPAQTRLDQHVQREPAYTTSLFLPGVKPGLFLTAKDCDRHWTRLGCVPYPKPPDRHYNCPDSPRDYHLQLGVEASG